MEIIITLLYIWLIPALALFISFMLGKYDVKFTDYKHDNKVSYIEGNRRILIYLLISILWPYIFIKNLVQGD